MSDPAKAISAEAKREVQAPDERLSMGEIDRRYPNEWVVLVDSDWTGMVTRSAVVAAHSPSKKEALTASKALRAAGVRHLAIFWTGPKMSPTAFWMLNGHVRQPV